MSSGQCRHPSSGFRSLRHHDVWGMERREISKCEKYNITVSNHFTYILSRVLCPVPCLHFYCSFCLETEKCPWRPKSVPLGQNRF
ncbi:unnamed protein product [Staurois parvus]|uniref:Uncharacterized protein n=1 Tax=Staurois parvus TaxID=386267 RepID=A0ABN9F2S3_9NEOB|nr:unnamed protein product [Staurois parvus]